jgi:Cu(I)/Ag(I) efflux system membrane fusion protein
VWRYIAYVGVLVAAVAAAWLATRGRSEAEASVQHDHGALAAADAASPVRLAPDAARRIGVTFAPVTAGPLTAEVRTVGEVTWDERRVTAVAPKIDGWVERLYVDFTGREVSVGEPLLGIYSPMLVTAQEELLLAVRLAREVAGGAPEARRAADELLASARRRLLYWDIPASEVQRIEETGEVTKTLTLRSPVQGVVIEKAVVEGQRIMAGESVLRVGDLRTVWVEGEIFERDLPLVRLGSTVDVELQAYPGERWHGRVTYLYPTVDAATRTARLRVELRNPGLRLKPGMYATISMPGARRAQTLSVPRSAVLVSGRRSVAFVQRADGQLEPRQVVTGLATDDRIEILQGLVAGETVVASATFLVDAESNLGAALQAMASPPE